MKDLMKKNQIERKDGCQNRWWVSELLAKDCEEAWIHAGWEDEKKKWRRRISERWIIYMIKSAEGSDGILHKITQIQRCGGEEYRSWRRRRKTRNCWSVAKQKKKRMVKTLAMQW